VPGENGNRPPSERAPADRSILTDLDTEIRLHFLGTGDAFGNGGRHQTCFWLEGAGESLLIDCGASSLTALKTAGVEPNDIGSVILSHLHGDHYGGLPFLVLDGQFRRRPGNLTIAGPPGTRDRVEAAMELLFPGSPDARRGFRVEFVEVGPREPTKVGPAAVTTVPVEQPGTPASALRVEYASRVVAYSGDTAWSDDLVELAAGADVFVAEAYFFDRQVPFHLDYKTLLAHRDRLKCKRIVLTHMSPDMLARQPEAEFECAHDGMVIAL
jgi:ribonuclease BN (tRNA processing enzyme)